MQKFTDFMAQNLTRGGYTVIDKSDQDVFAWSPVDGKPIWVCYLTAEISPEQIRRSFDFKGYILYVVDDKLIPQDITDRTSTPMWLRVIHGLYMGRVYTWNGRFLYGLHFDYEAGVINESGILTPDRLLLLDSDTLLRGWNDTYRIARMMDKAWWASEQRNQYYHNGGWQQSGGKWEYTGAAGKGYSKTYDTPWAKQESAPPKQRDFKAEFRACKGEAEAKTLYKQLAKQYHPDLNLDTDTTLIMQQINAAWDYMQGWWS